jgi:hypothetical protein
MENTTQFHQPGQGEFRATLSEDVDWKPFPAFPPAARLAVVVGQPTEPGPYLIRVKVPGGVKLMPHRHPEDRVYTVISGVFHIGLGDEFERRQTTGVSARCGDRFAGEYIALPLGDIRRVRHTSNSDRSPGTGIRQGERRSAKQQRIGGIRTAPCKAKKRERSNLEFGALVSSCPERVLLGGRLLDRGKGG